VDAVKRVSSVLAAAIVAWVAGCRRESPRGTAEKSFKVHGVFLERTADGRRAVIRHDEIPGYMPAMTMRFTLSKPAEAETLHGGDEVEFTLRVGEEESRIEALTRIASGSNRPPVVTEGDPGRKRMELADGDILPEHSFTTEEGNVAHLSDFRGGVLAFTFIFTRCPLPEFCPRMSRRFSEVRDILEQEGGSPANWRLLSLSFDPEHDTPAALSAYARAYRGTNQARWLFGVLSPEELARFAPEVDLKVRKEGGSLSHNLRTVVVDPNGRIFRHFDDNEWTARRLADAMREAAQQ
jgi:protein SCO1